MKLSSDLSLLHHLPCSTPPLPTPSPPTPPLFCPTPLPFLPHPLPLPLLPVVKDRDGTHQLNFARLVMNYAKQFALTDSREALQYYFLLRGVAEARPGSDGRDLFEACISDLAIESREFELLLGRVQADGSRKAGCVDKFLEQPSEIICTVAQDAEDKGLFEDAVRLYDLAQV